MKLTVFAALIGATMAVCPDMMVQKYFTDKDCSKVYEPKKKEETEEKTEENTEEKTEEEPKEEVKVSKPESGKCEEYKGTAYGDAHWGYLKTADV